MSELVSFPLYGRPDARWILGQNPKRRAETLYVPYQGDQRLPLRVAIAHWELYLRSGNRSPKTVRSYVESARLLEAFLLDKGHSTIVTEISLHDLSRFISDQLAQWRPATAAVRFRCLKQLFRWLVRSGHLEYSPMQVMQAPRVPDEAVPVISDDELRKLFHACNGDSFADHRDLAILLMMLDTGVRLGEIAQLRIEDVDLGSDSISVCGKGSRWRRVPFTTSTRQVIDRYLRSRSERAPAYLIAMWLSARGAFAESGISQMLKRRCRQAGIPDLHPHQFRHTAAHRWLERGGSEGDAMRIFGWRSRAMLDRYGSDLAASRAEAAYRRIMST